MAPDFWWEGVEQELRPVRGRLSVSGRDWAALALSEEGAGRRRGSTGGVSASACFIAEAKEGLRTEAVLGASGWGDVGSGFERVAGKTTVEFMAERQAWRGQEHKRV